MIDTWNFSEDFVDLRILFKIFMLSNYWNLLDRAFNH